MPISQYLPYSATVIQ